VVTVDVLDRPEAELRAEVVRLRRRVATLSAMVRLLVAVLWVSGGPSRIDLGDRATRAKLLRAAEQARRVLPTRAVLKILRISHSRYQVWVREGQGCELDERTMCVRSTPTQLTPDEVRVI